MVRFNSSCSTLIQAHLLHFFVQQHFNSHHVTHKAENAHTLVGGGQGQRTLFSLSRMLSVDLSSSSGAGRSPCRRDRTVCPLQQQILGDERTIILLGFQVVQKKVRACINAPYRLSCVSNRLLAAVFIFFVIGGFPCSHVRVQIMIRAVRKFRIPSL